MPEEKITTYRMAVTVFLLGIQELEKESLNKKLFQTGKKIIKEKEKICCHLARRKEIFAVRAVIRAAARLKAIARTDFARKVYIMSVIKLQNVFMDVMIGNVQINNFQLEAWGSLDTEEVIQ